MSSDSAHILDTVVLLYFLLAEQSALLRQLNGHPLCVPLAVYDPEDRSLTDDALRHSELLSEMRQSVRHYEVAARTAAASPVLLDRVRRVDELFDSGQLAVVEMSDAETQRAAKLQSREGVIAYKLRAPLGPGEAACVAIAYERGWTIVTDDDAALIVLDHLHGGRTYGYERIRKLLVRAADEELITKDEANAIHAQMRELGFWDQGTPFPDL